MPIPFIVPVTVAAGTIGFLIGRKMASTSEDGHGDISLSEQEDEHEDISLSDQEDEQPECGEEGDAVPFGMTEAEALQVLELETGATPDEIREAHRRLVKRFHPDLGGSSYLAGLINRAKAVLLDGVAESED